MCASVISAVLVISITLLRLAITGRGSGILLVNDLSAKIYTLSNEIKVCYTARVQDDSQLECNRGTEWLIATVTAYYYIR